MPGQAQEGERSVVVEPGPTPSTDPVRHRPWLWKGVERMILQNTKKGEMLVLSRVWKGKNNERKKRKGSRCG